MPAFDGTLRRPKYVFESSLQKAAKIGYDGIEITMQYPLSEIMTKEDIDRMKEDAKKYGVETPTLSADWAWQYADYHKKLNEWTKCGNAIKSMKGDVKLASTLGAKAMLIHFGNSRGTWEEAQGILSDLAKEAGKYKVKLGFEGNIWRRNQGLGDLDALARMVNEIGSKYLGIYVHYTDATVTQAHEGSPSAMTPEQEFEIAGKNLVCIHSSGIYPESKIDYKGLLATIRKYYDWYWVFEIREDTMESNKKAMDELIAKYW